MLEEGYAAVTSRRVAAKANLKPQLVHYYFRTMDDLFLAIHRRRVAAGHGTSGSRPRVGPAALGPVGLQPRSPGHGADDGVHCAGEPPQGHPSRNRQLGRAVPRRAAERVPERAPAARHRPGAYPPIVCTVVLSSISRFLGIEHEALGMLERARRDGRLRRAVHTPARGRPVSGAGRRRTRVGSLRTAPGSPRDGRRAGQVRAAVRLARDRDEPVLLGDHVPPARFRRSWPKSVE